MEMWIAYVLEWWFWKDGIQVSPPDSNDSGKWGGKVYLVKSELDLKSASLMGLYGGFENCRPKYLFKGRTLCRKDRENISANSETNLFLSKNGEGGFHGYSQLWY